MKGTSGREGPQRLPQPPTRSLCYILMLPGMISFNFAWNEQHARDSWSTETQGHDPCLLYYWGKTRARPSLDPWLPYLRRLRGCGTRSEHCLLRTFPPGLPEENVSQDNGSDGPRRKTQILLWVKKFLEPGGSGGAWVLGNNGAGGGGGGSNCSGRLSSHACS